MEPKGKSDASGFRRLQSDVDKMLIELVRGERTPRYGRAAFRPSADVYYDRRDNAVIVKLELPGIDPHAIALEVEENVLRVSGVRSDQRHPDVVYQQMEITYGRFERALRLPPEVAAAEASAKYSGGYLEIVLPVKQRAAGKRIPITMVDEALEEEQS